MSRIRLFTDAPLAAGSDVELRGEEAHYLGRVLRLRSDHEITLFDGSGAEFCAIIRNVARNRIMVAVTRRIDRNVESPLRLHLVQAVSRGERMDFVVQKATELGVFRITPVLTEFSMVRLDPERADKRLQHWQGIARSACEQCGRNRLPVIDQPVALSGWLEENHLQEGGGIILQPGAAGSLRDVSPWHDPLAVVVGPEGGFSEAEYGMAAASGFRAVGLGPRVLRTETAAIAVLAALQALSGDLR